MYASKVKLLLCWCLVWGSTSLQAQPAIISSRDIFKPVLGQHAMVVTGEPQATAIGLEVLRKGGNAVDAAVTIGFTLAVTLPRAGNIGGGGFMLIYRPAAKKQGLVALDYREKAPAKAHANMFLDQKGQVDPRLSRFSHLAVGVPGTVAGLALALQKYGTISLAQALAPAIRLASQGFPISRGLCQDIRRRARMLRRWPATRKIFFKPDGSFYQPGEIFRQPQLARTLQMIARQGPRAFYRGAIADLLVKDMAQHGGFITHQDLAAYRPAIRQPVHGTYRGYDIYSMCPPSSGGVHIVQILNILEGYDLRALGSQTAATIHLMAEAMKRAYADRARYLGDTDFVKVPLAGLLSKSYAAKLRAQINQQQATPSSQIQAGRPPSYESSETTHYSVVDQQGNAVANTYTINFSFGSGIVVPGAGFLLNNEMDDFSAKPGVPNAYGLIGSQANAIAPHKRMLSSMSPTIVLHQGHLFLVAGSPGGSRIITTTLQVILNVIDHQMNIQEAVNAPRIHHQWLPDELRIEEGFSGDTLRILQRMGHHLALKSVMGCATCIMVDPKTGMRYGAADPRRLSKALGY